MYKRLLMPTDGSACSLAAIREGLEVAKTLGAEVTFLYVLENPTGLWMAPESGAYIQELTQDLRKVGQAALEEAEKLAKEAGVASSGKLREGNVTATILDEAKNYDLLVMGTHGRTGLDKLLLGSVTEGVLHRTDKPVLVVRSR
ncbi:universal stress protein [Calidithermus timidus]|jgi:nucleotide-binding universal stress UspA family protein|uniref:universal stress protein n=1 Tax=Calidithermus timidus TaxID=307124 RepID=UPI000382BD6B|nr:universal stress protein [Calidithermus timidus]